MNEHYLQLIASLKIIWLAVFTYLYGSGGISNKWLRRFVGAIWMVVGIFLFSFLVNTWHNWYLVSLPIMIGGLSNGYGADKTWDKIRRRALQGFIFSCASIPLVAFSHLWILFGLDIVISVLSCVVIGAFDAPKNARDNETLIATLCFLLKLYLI